MALAVSEGLPILATSPCDAENYLNKSCVYNGLSELFADLDGMVKFKERLREHSLLNVSAFDEAALLKSAKDLLKACETALHLRAKRE